MFVQVVALPGEAVQPAFIWKSDWERAMSHAAAVATPAIFPRTNECRGPWMAWRGYLVPPDVLYKFEEASAAEEDRRYDEALSLYLDALAVDPKNREIRGRIGQLQEKVGLFLDALVTYDNMLALERPAERVPRRLYRRSTRVTRNKAFLIARYRRSGLLGGDRVTEQWLRSDKLGGAGTRDVDRRILRQTLMGFLPALKDADALKKADGGEAVREAFTVEAKRATAASTELVGRTCLFKRRMPVTLADVRRYPGERPSLNLLAVPIGRNGGG